jgi:hypothetical protein
MKTMAHSVVISRPWTSPRDDRLDDQIALHLTFSVGKTNGKEGTQVAARERYTVCVSP